MNRTMASNKYGEGCTIHNKECGLYCPYCKAFICNMCDDPHIRSGSIIHSNQIMSYLTIIIAKQEVDQIKETRCTIEQVIAQAIQTVSRALGKLVQRLDTFSLPSLQADLASFSNLPKDSIAIIDKLLESKELRGRIKKAIMKSNFNLRSAVNYAERIIKQVKSCGNSIDYELLDKNKTLENLSKSYAQASPFAFSYPMKFSFDNWQPNIITKQNAQTELNKSYKSKIIFQNLCNLDTHMKKATSTQIIVNAIYTEKTVEPNIVHSWKGSDITIYDPIHQKKTITVLNHSINAHAGSISYGSRIFIIGGQIISNVYEVSFQYKELKDKKSMLIPKCLHSLCSNNGYIYSIGGNNGSIVGDCEKYDIQNDKWDALPTLLTSRQASAVFVHNGCIYCMCGSSKDNPNNNLIEKLNIGKSKWEYVSAISPISARRDMHGIQFNDNQVIVFGGSNGNIFSDSYLLNIGKDSIEFVACANLGRPSYFYSCTAPVVVNGMVYVIDHTRLIHIYANSIWKFIE